MSLINDMLNDLEKNKDSDESKKNNKQYPPIPDNKDSSNSSVTLNPDTQEQSHYDIDNSNTRSINIDPEGTPDISLNKNSNDTTKKKTATFTEQAPQMPPADDEEHTSASTTYCEAKPQKESFLNLNINSATDISNNSNSELDTNKETGKVSDKESSMNKEYRQPWQSSQQFEQSSQHNTSDDDYISDDSVTPISYSTKKSTNKRMIIWIIILVVVCLVLGYFILWPSKKTPSSKPMIVPSKPIISITEDTPANSQTTETSPRETKKNNNSNLTNTTQSSDPKTKTDENKKITDNETTSSDTIHAEESPIDPMVQREQDYLDLMNQINSLSATQMMEKLQNFVQQHPNFNRAKLALASLYIKSNHKNDGLQLINSVLAKDPTNRQFAELKAHLLVENNQIEKALQLLHQAQPATINSDPNYYAFMAGLYLQTKQYEQASNLYSSLTAINPHNATWWAGLGISLQKQNNPIAANDAFNKAETLGGLSPALEAYVDQALQGQA